MVTSVMERWTIHTSSSISVLGAVSLSIDEYGLVLGPTVRAMPAFSGTW